MTFYSAAVCKNKDRQNAYVGTRVEIEIKALLARGGFVGGIRPAPRSRARLELRIRWWIRRTARAAKICSLSKTTMFCANPVSYARSTIRLLAQAGCSRLRANI